jgi:acyl-coenzyme A synthetase/AMP-(fatty) acid ligase
MPQRWYLLDEIPRTSRGKLNRENVARQCADLPQVRLPPRSAATDGR